MALTDELMDMVGNAGGLGALGGLLGGNEDVAKGAMGLAVPALLGGLGKRAATPNGASAVFDLVNGSDGGMLDNLGGFLGGGDKGGMGSMLLGSILGGRKDTVESGLAQATGINPGMISKFLPMLAPVVMSFLKRKVMGGGMNSGGLASALFSERSNNTNPAVGGILDMLDGGDDAADDAGFLDGINKMGALGGVGSATSAASAKFDNAKADVRNARVDVPEVKASPTKWLLPLVGLIAAAVLVGALWANRDGGDSRDSVVTQLEDGLDINTTAAGCLFDELGNDSLELLKSDPAGLTAIDIEDAKSTCNVN